MRVTASGWLLNIADAANNVSPVTNLERSVAKRKTKQLGKKRPYATHYFNSPNDKDAAESSHGACSSERGAIRASIVRIFEGQYGKAVIQDRITGANIYTVTRGPGGLKVSYGSGVAFKEWVARAA